MVTEIIRAAVYARTSSAQQKTCKTQLELCTKLAHERGWKVTHKLSDDALKGRNPNRPGLRRLIELAEDQRIEAIIVWKLDRFFRSLKEASITQELLKDLGVNLVSVTEPFDTTTSLGRFLFGNLINFAQLETDLLRERAQLGHERRVQEGKWTGNIPPFGYAISKNGELKINPEEAKVIELLHSKYARMQGDRRVSDWLNSRGLTWRGQRWTTDKVRKILTNRLSIGELTQRGTTVKHETLQIITNARFKKTENYRQGLQHLGSHITSTGQSKRLDEILNEYISTLPTERTKTLHQ